MRVKKASETKAAHNDDYASHDRFEDDEWKKEDYPDDYYDDEVTYF